MVILDLDKYELSDRAGSYGGKAGFKDSIYFDNSYWIVKYPKSTKGMNVEDLSYSTAPLSEYIGSHIYKILGFPVHDTLLGYRNGKIVVACRDFCKVEGSLREVRTIKNLANPVLADLLERSFSETDDGATNLEEILLHLKHNDILSKVDGIYERFWECIVVDALINNNDRNNGNWGILKEDGKYVIAPIYDNGASFSNKVPDTKIRKYLSDDKMIEASALNTICSYGKDGKKYTVRYLFGLGYKDLNMALERLYPIIVKKFDEIKIMIYDIPEEYNGLYVCSPERKKFYIKSMECRIEKILLPTLQAYRNEISPSKSLMKNDDMVR